MYLKAKQNKIQKPIKVNSNGLSFKSISLTQMKHDRNETEFLHKRKTFWHFDSDSKIGFG